VKPGAVESSSDIGPRCGRNFKDMKADWAKMAADQKTQEWWAIMEPMQDPLPTRKEGEWWAEMEEVFHMDQLSPNAGAYAGNQVGEKRCLICEKVASLLPSDCL
jgi:L-rhamnose mutarotase-like protein